MEEYLTVGDIAKLMGVTPQNVRLMVHDGKLVPVAQTAGGIKLYRREDAERLAALRAAYHANRSAQGRGYGRE